MWPKAPRVRVGDKEETSVNSCGLRNPEWETSVGDKCKLMRPKAPRVGDKGEASVNSCEPKAPRVRVGDKGETSVNSCGPRHPEWEASVNSRGRRHPEWRQGGDKCKLMRPRAP